MFTKKVLILALFFCSIQNASADVTDISSMSCNDMRNAAAYIHVQCLNTFYTCTDIKNQFQSLDCTNVSVIGSDNNPLNNTICNSLAQIIADCNFINGAHFYEVAVSDIWSNYVRKRCNVIEGDLCSINIGGVNIYDPCIHEPAVNNSTTYDCRLSNTGNNSTPTQAPSAPAPPAPIEESPVAPSVPAPPAPIEESPVAPSVPAPPAPIEESPVAPSVPAPPAPIEESPVAPSVPAPTKPLHKYPLKPESATPLIIRKSKRPMIAMLEPVKKYVDVVKLETSLV